MTKAPPAGRCLQNDRTGERRDLQSRRLFFYISPHSGALQRFRASSLLHNKKSKRRKALRRFIYRDKIITSLCKKEGLPMKRYLSALLALLLALTAAPGLCSEEVTANETGTQL